MSMDSKPMLIDVAEVEESADGEAAAFLLELLESCVWR